MEITAQLPHVLGPEYYPNDGMEDYWRRQQERSTAPCPEQAPRSGSFADMCGDASTSRKAEVHKEMELPSDLSRSGEGEALRSGIAGHAIADVSCYVTADSDIEVDACQADAAADGDGDSSSYASAEAEPEVDSSVAVETTNDGDTTVDVEADCSSYTSAEADVDVENSSQHEMPQTEITGVASRVKFDLKKASQSQNPPSTYTKVVTKNITSNDVLIDDLVGVAHHTAKAMQHGMISGNSEDSASVNVRLANSAIVTAATYDDIVNGTAADIIAVSGDAKNVDNIMVDTPYLKAAGSSGTSAAEGGEMAAVAAVALRSQRCSGAGVHEGDAVDGGDGGYGSGGDGDGDGMHGGPRGDESAAPEDNREDREGAAGGKGEGKGKGKGDAGVGPGIIAAAAAPAAAAQREGAGDKAGGGCAGDGVYKAADVTAQAAKEHESHAKCAATCTICGTTSSHPLSALAEPWYPRSYTQLYVQANLPVDKI